MSAVEAPPATLYGLKTLEGENLTPPETRSSGRGILARNRPSNDY
jgi:hypothetical protein